MVLAGWIDHIPNEEYAGKSRRENAMLALLDENNQPDLQQGNEGRKLTKKTNVESIGQSQANRNIGTPSRDVIANMKKIMIQRLQENGITNFNELAEYLAIEPKHAFCTSQSDFKECDLDSNDKFKSFVSYLCRETKEKRIDSSLRDNFQFSVVAKSNLLDLVEAIMPSPSSV